MAAPASKGAIIGNTLLAMLLLGLDLVRCQPLAAQEPSVNGLLTSIWVNPQNGSDSNNGSSVSTPLRTLTAAWAMVPENVPLTSRYTIYVLQGTLALDAAPTAYRNRLGSALHSVNIVASGGVVILPPSTVTNCPYLTFVGVTFLSLTFLPSVPGPSPHPSPSPRPGPTPSPSPGQSPNPTPRFSPAPSFSPRQNPSPSPSPRPSRPSPHTPSPSPRPRPSPAPSPASGPSPAPGPLTLSVLIPLPDGLPSLPDGRPFDIGAPTLREIWVDPVHGADTASGNSRAAALRTLSAAWRLIPEGLLTTTGYHIMITAGSLTASQAPNYWEARHGTSRFPIMLEAADGPGTALVPPMNVYNVSRLYLIGLNVTAVQDGGDIFHCELCSNVLFRNCSVVSLSASTDETIKMNQCMGVYIENSLVSGSQGNAIDYVAVQFGHLLRSEVRNSDYCVYFKGGSAYHLVDSNHIHDCDSTGFGAGQGTGLQYMVPPFFHYEAYDIKVVNNVVSDVVGAAFGAWGGYNILFAHNTAYRIGNRSHTVEAIFGSRSCDDDPTARKCAEYEAAGAWGPATISSNEEDVVNIPNRHVRFLNNLFFNPAPYQSQWQQINVFGSSPSNSRNMPRVVRADDDVAFQGNVWWNGGADMPVGAAEPGSDSSAGCPSTNAACNMAQLLRDNVFNQVLPQLVDPGSGNFRPAAGGSLLSSPAVQSTHVANIAPFSWGDAPGTEPPGTLDNQWAVARDFRGVSRGSNAPPGAFAS